MQGGILEVSTSTRDIVRTAGLLLLGVANPLFVGLLTAWWISSWIIVSVSEGIISRLWGHSDIGLKSRYQLVVLDDQRWVIYTSGDKAIS